MPTLFLSHGSPLLAILDSAAHRFLRGARLLMYPAADLPVVQVSIDSARDAAWHFGLGRALRPLRDEGVLLIGSGGATHNLGLYMYAGARGDAAPPPAWVAQFDDWVAQAIDEHSRSVRRAR